MRSSTRAVPSPESASGAWALFLSPDPLIDFPCFNNASFWLMRADRAGCDVVCLRKHLLRKPLGLSLGRESFGLSRVPRPTNRSDRNEPAIDGLGQNGSPRAASWYEVYSDILTKAPPQPLGQKRSRGVAVPGLKNAETEPSHIAASKLDQKNVSCGLGIC
jgi:hypothetical protein